MQTRSRGLASHRKSIVGTALVAAALLTSSASFMRSAAAQPKDTKAADTKTGGGKPSDSKGGDAKAGEPKAGEPKKEEWNLDDEPEEKPKPVEKPTVEPPPEVWSSSNVEEVPGKTYLFVGLRYRGNIVPKFMLNAFVDEGGTIYSNSIGAELDIRKDGFSFIPALTFTELGTGDLLFKQKDRPDIAANYSLVNSSMKVIYATADLLWSTKVAKNVDFEYGVGLGLGVVFGDLVNNWLQEDPNGQLTSETGKRLSPCATVLPAGTGCNARDHQNSDVDKVGNYTEKDWFSGGSKPVFFPWITPQVGVRVKPIKQFVGRIGLGFGLTGPWFGLSGEYGLEKKPNP